MKKKKDEELTPAIDDLDEGENVAATPPDTSREAYDLYADRERAEKRLPEPYPLWKSARDRGEVYG